MFFDTAHGNVKTLSKFSPGDQRDPQIADGVVIKMRMPSTKLGRTSTTGDPQYIENRSAPQLRNLIGRKIQPQRLVLR